MNSNQTAIRIDVDAWKIKIRERRNNRMRLQINLSKDEAIAFKNFASVCKPEEVSDEDFLKTVFLTGIEGMNQQLADLVKKYAKENKEDLASSGITVLEGDDGEIKLASTEDLASQASGAGTIADNVLHDDAIRKHTNKK
jgi:hypothetical protein|tara:strand:- start:311 stop:730 length:420 start_codon:yes stop_codon:yes gene_type:complete